MHPSINRLLLHLVYFATLPEAAYGVTTGWNSGSFFVFKILASAALSLPFVRAMSSS